MGLWPERISVLQQQRTLFALGGHSEEVAVYNLGDGLSPAVRSAAPSSWTSSLLDCVRAPWSVLFCPGSHRWPKQLPRSFCSAPEAGEETSWGLPSPHPASWHAAGVHFPASLAVGWVHDPEFCLTDVDCCILHHFSNCPLTLQNRSPVPALSSLPASRNQLKWKFLWAQKWQNLSGNFSP